jgi:hypothetical protein
MRVNQLTISRRRHEHLPKLLILLLTLTMTACGGAYSATNTGAGGSGGTGGGAGGGGTGTAPMQGSWEVLFHPDAAPDQYTVLEANLTQSGTQLSVDPANALLFQAQGTIPWVMLLHVSQLGGKCGIGSADQVTFDSTLTNLQPVAQSLSFTLTENGPSGSAVITASATTDGTSTLDGTYTLPAACGFPAETGTFQGFKDSAKFSSLDSYAGTVQGNSTTVNFTSASSGYGLTGTGTYNGAPLALNGSTTGMSLTLTGTVSGQTATWFGLYDSTYNTFRIYDSSANQVGALSSVP